MELLYLGTAAAEGIPSPWCRCDNCRSARQEGGRSIRLRSMMLVDGRLLIDFGPDLVAAALKYDVELADLETLLITHEHSDHAYVHNLGNRRHSFCPTPLPTLDIYGTNGALKAIRDFPLSEEEMRVKAHEIKPFETWTSDGYRITALLAYHGNPPMVPLIYAISDGSSSLLYAHDTGRFPDETWDYLINPPGGERWRFDVVSMDSTGAVLNHRDGTHMTGAEVIEHRDRLQQHGLLKPDARVLANHYSHNGTPAYTELVEFLNKSGVEASYDGLKIAI